MNKKGLTLVELLVVMVIFVLVIAAVSQSFIYVLRHQARQVGIAENNINSLVGLNILRKDIEMAGFGLPYVLDNYNEAVDDSKYSPNPTTFNDAPNNPPRPFVSDNGSGPNNSDVLVIKSTVASLNDYVRNWGYLTKYKYIPLNQSDEISDTYFSEIDLNRFRFIGYNKKSSFQYPSGQRIFLAFGISSQQPRMPFNRADYFLYLPSTMPSRCASGTYELYRANINQADGKRNNPQPLLDCILDFQVAFGVYDKNSNKIIWKQVMTDDAAAQRSNLKQVRVFIVQQIGKYDPNFYYDDSTIAVGDDRTGVLNVDHLTEKQRHYRWKTIELVVNPLNLSPKEK
ncbi:prepilin-type N-terminal cleavage/methylation domain-containing protein [Hippea jasoniae]|uniref:prepilin-type N-terminal cleavage/methylation domain-containing protein n=1 Tax=Hippea jasoniae TaxID=944479 RepID=UPI000555028A|nr:PilW family protein [Hippea jasoniae]